MMIMGRLFLSMKKFQFVVTTQLVLQLVLVLLQVQVTTAVKLQSDGTCALLTMIPFTDKRENPTKEIANDGVEYYGNGQWSSPQGLGKAAFSYLATAQIAKDHFNQRNPIVVPALAGDDDESNFIMKDCDIQFSNDGLDWYVDSAYSRSVTVDAIIAIERNSSDPDNAVCAMIGPIDSRANEGASVLAENLNIPQIAYSTIERTFDRKHDFPTFARGIPTAEDFAITLASLIQRDIWVRDFLAVIYRQAEYGEQWEHALEDGEELFHYHTLADSILESDPNSIVDALEQVVRIGYHTILLTNDQPAILDDVAQVAYDMGLLGEEYLWILSGEIVPPELFSTFSFKVDSPEDMLLRGASIITNYDPFIYQPENDPFLMAWRSEGDELLNRLKEFHPLPPTHEGYYMGESGYFQMNDPDIYSSFLYDAIITAGISACQSQKSGLHHVDEIFQTNFKGASGHVLYKEGTNGRNASGVTFGVYNIRPGDIDEVTNTRGYTRHLVAIYDGQTEKWTQVDDFVYFDGTNYEPMPLRDTVDWNYLSDSTRIVGFVLMGVSLLNIFACTAWIIVMRKDRIVTAAQPEFLYLISFGATLQASSLIFQSFDENSNILNHGWSDKMLNHACAAFPWLFIMGYLIQYSAVFSKLWRLSKLLSLRRQTVHVKQVLLPFSAIITSSVVVLILWQIFDPFTWERDLLSDDVAHPWESYGECRNKGSVMPYVIPLAFLGGTIIVMTLAISWKMRAVQSDLSEANWIFIAIFSHLQIWIIGIPVFLILDGISRDASYLITVALIVIFSNAFICLIIWPKIVTKHFSADDQGRRSATTIGVMGANTHISGLQPTSPMHNSGISLPGWQSSCDVKQDNAVNQQAQNKNLQNLSSTSIVTENLKVIHLEAQVEDLKRRLADTNHSHSSTQPEIPEASRECQ